MDQREELARLIKSTKRVGETVTYEEIAAAILAAGWEKRSLAGEVGWRPISEAGDLPPRGQRYLGWVEDDVRIIAWGKTSHLPWEGWCLADQGAEDFDLCKPTHFMPLPAPPADRASGVEK